MTMYYRFTLAGSCPAENFDQFLSESHFWCNWIELRLDNYVSTLDIAVRLSCFITNYSTVRESMSLDTFSMADVADMIETLCSTA